jgi:2-amino-4-hydroxy-6-hydroxymethyldihydropteridine diphosphokinase
MSMRAFLGLGSNLGERLGFLRDAVATLREVGLVGVSPVYETRPIGGPAGQGPYLNLVVELRTDRTPHELLGVCRRLEAAAGRVRDERWGPRTLDVDVLWVDGATVDDPDLVVPHPRMWERRFVVAPLHDLAPDVADEAALAASLGPVERLGTLDEL